MSEWLSKKQMGMKTANQTRWNFLKEVLSEKRRKNRVLVKEEITGYKDASNTSFLENFMKRVDDKFRKIFVTSMQLY